MHFKCLNVEFIYEPDSRRGLSVFGTSCVTTCVTWRVKSFGFSASAPQLSTSFFLTSMSNCVKPFGLSASAPQLSTSFFLTSAPNCVKPFGFSASAPQLSASFLDFYVKLPYWCVDCDDCN